MWTWEHGYGLIDTVHKKMYRWLDQRLMRTSMTITTFSSQNETLFALNVFCGPCQSPKWHVFCELENEDC